MERQHFTNPKGQFLYPFDDVTAEFKFLIEWFAEKARAAKVPVEPYSGHKPSHFLTLPHEAKVQTAKQFAIYVEICNEALEAGDSLLDNKAILWRFIKKLGLRQSSDLFSLFGKNDIIEVYDLSNFVQIFRNLRFFTVCSYTLDDILCRPFWELYKKDQEVTDKIISNATKLARQEVTETIHYDGEKHSLFEIDSEKMYHAHVENRFIAPLMDRTGKTVAAVHSIYCHALKSNSGVIF